MPPPDILILGAGASGLSAAIELARAGLRIEILEARDRVGGRIFTQHDPNVNHAVELGAEFVHGLAPETWLPLQQNNVPVTEVEGELWCSMNGKLQPCNFFAQTEEILAAMDDQSPDESFLDFLARRFPGREHDEAKQWATGYVSGFNAADPAQVSVQWLVHNRRADEQIEGDRAFRIAGGYQTLLNLFQNELNSLGVPVQLNTVARRVDWRPDFVEMTAHTEVGDSTFKASRALITLPLGVLQAVPGSVLFHPDLPREKQFALQKLAMGKVVRVTLCFRDRFWQSLRPTGQDLAREDTARKDAAREDKTLTNLSFLFSHDDLFPTWWTQMPLPLPVISGWAPAQSAEHLSGMSEHQIIEKAMASLSGLLRLEQSEVESQLTAYFHDWDSDPFSRGAYSYAKVGGEGCQQTLAAPIENTLFFAGEATDTGGHNGTVHGAIASGKRAAKEILGASR